MKGTAVGDSWYYLRILVTRPAPTVRPPSRIAKRRPSSIATGWIRLDGHVDVVARHNHLGALGQLHDTGNVGGAEVELRTVVVEERGVAAALVLGQDVDGALELGVRGVSAWLDDNLAALNVLALDTAEQQTTVVASLGVVEELAEHLDTGNGGLLDFSRIPMISTSSFTLS